MASIVRTQTIAADDLYADAPAFADVVHVLTTPPPGYSWTPSNRVYHLSALFAYSLAHPLQFIQWAGDEFDVAGKMVKLVDGKASRKVQFGAHIARDLVCAPCGSPEMRSRQMLGHASRRPAPPSKGCVRHILLTCLWPGLTTRLRLRTVRIKWYPNAKAIRQWPKDLGELWMDLPFDADGGVDLRPAMRTWRMENCHVSMHPHLQSSTLLITSSDSRRESRDAARLKVPFRAALRSGGQGAIRWTSRDWRSR